MADDMVPKGDKPRLIIVCSPDDYRAVQEGVTKLGHGDVLVRANRLIDQGQAYIIKGSALDMPDDLFEPSVLWSDHGGNLNEWKAVSGA